MKRTGAGLRQRGLHVVRTGVLVSALLLAPGAIAHDGCAPGALRSIAPEETSQFDFLIGEHDVSLHGWQGDAWTLPRPVGARWDGWYGLSGTAIVDEWYDPAPTAEKIGGRGINVRMFDPAEKLWKMMWISSSGHQVQDLRAEIRDGVLTMWQVYPDRPGWKAEFEVLDENRWARTSYQQDEEGNWRPQFKLVATRRSCEDGR